MILKRFVYFSLLSIFVLSPITPIALRAEETDLDAGIDFESTDPLLVSLGSFCGPASHIRSIGFRKAAFPLDWVLSVDGEKIIELLEDNFAYFFDVKYLAYNLNAILLQKYYHIEFSHEGDYSGNNFYHRMPEFFEKYSRRIERFRKLKEYKGKIFFVRSAWPLSDHPNYSFQDPGNLEISAEYSQRLYAALQKFFPNVDVHLIILNSSPNGEIEPMKIIDKIVIIKDASHDLRKVIELYTQVDSAD